MRKVAVIGLLFVLVTLAEAQSSSEYLVNAIKEGRLVKLRKALKKQDVNGYYGSSEKLPLHIAIENDKFQVVRCLIRHGADPEKHSHGKTSLIHAAENGNLLVAEYLISRGVNVNGVSERKNTPLIYAAYKGHLDMVKLLVDKGADINYRNAAGKTALDYATTFRHNEVMVYLKLLKAESESMFYPSYTDGPHILWNDSVSGIVFYLVRDSASNSVAFESGQFEMHGNSYILRGLLNDTLDYQIVRHKDPGPALIHKNTKILALGDIHGEYEPLVSLLKSQGVIDEKLNWSWDNGHLVFLGDIFDRGSDVTRILWLVYKLEQQAQVSGGRVHYLLGNHELMILEGDIRDISQKYLFLTDALDFNYSDLFALNTELGRWIRSRNTVVKIGEVIFLHAGISPSLLEKKTGLEKINRLITGYLLEEPDTTAIEELEFLLADEGPFWYRGYFGPGRTYGKADRTLIKNTLGFYEAKALVVGHTNVEKITPMFGFRVFATDVSFHKEGIELEGLLIEDGVFYRTMTCGSRELIYDPAYTD